MKAITFEQYGQVEEVLKLQEMERPSPGDNEVLVKINATAVNDYDWSMVRGKPHIYRLMYGLSKPKHLIPGMELAGVVEQVGANVQQFKPGDAVFGDTSDVGFGTFAEYVCTEEKALVTKPEALSFEEAAAIPHAFALAWQALKDMGQIAHGQKVLINGGGGGVGTLGLQIAKTHDCEVTGVDTGDKLKMMQSIGFDHVLDYRKTDFTRNGEQYDLILDCKTNRSAFAYRRSLRKGGQYITVGGDLPQLLGLLFWGKLMALFSRKTYRILSLKANKGLDQFIELYGQNKIHAQIDGPYPLEETSRLVQYFGEGKHKGKIIIQPTT